MAFTGARKLAVRRKDDYLQGMTKDDMPKPHHADLDREAMIRKLIRQTVGSMGETAPEALPHMVRERLKGQIAGDADLDRLLREVLKERGEGPGRG